MFAQQVAIGAQHFEKIGAKGAVFLWHQAGAVVVRGLVAHHRQSAKTDILQLTGRGADANPRRTMGEQFASFVTRRAEPDFPSLGTLKLLIREHFLAPTPTTPVPVVPPLGNATH